MLAFSLLLGGTLSGKNVDADSTFTDYKPEYKQWQTNYIIDKIDYQKDKTVVYFRFVSEFGGGEITYYSPTGVSPWYLKDVTSSSGIPKRFDLIEIRNITVNGAVKCRLLDSRLPQFVLPQVSGEVHTCEVVFPKLPAGVKVVDMIEGRGNEQSEIHFNAFKVNVKTPDSKNLGTAKEMAQKVNDFQRKFGIASVDTPTEEKTSEPLVTKPKYVSPIYFQNASLSWQSQEIVRQNLEFVYDYIQVKPEATIVIRGHADVNAPDDLADKLSKDRADLVAAQLVRLGVPESKITVISEGKRNPKHKDSNGRNRRVDIELID